MDFLRGKFQFLAIPLSNSSQPVTWLSVDAQTEVVAGVKTGTQQTDSKEFQVFKEKPFS